MLLISNLFIKKEDEEWVVYSTSGKGRLGGLVVAALELLTELVERESVSMGGGGTGESPLANLSSVTCK